MTGGMSGYSGTPLAKKLSLKDGQIVVFEAMPDSVRATILAQGLALDVRQDPAGADAIVHFTTEAAALGQRLKAARTEIAQTGFVWVAWPKRAAKVATDITEDAVRDLALPLGFVDVKVCAIDAIWSGLKLMIRKELRGT